MFHVKYCSDNMSYFTIQDKTQSVFVSASFLWFGDNCIRRFGI